MSDTDTANLHPDYGPCDAFGPNHECSVCIGIVERDNGEWIVPAEHRERVMALLKLSANVWSQAITSTAPPKES